MGDFCQTAWMFSRNNPADRSGYFLDFHKSCYSNLYEKKVAPRTKISEASWVFRGGKDPAMPTAPIPLEIPARFLAKIPEDFIILLLRVADQMVTLFGIISAQLGE